VQTTQDATIQPMERQRTVFDKADRKRDIFFWQEMIENKNVLFSFFI
jgi:hypothetical protein